jgi:hypothetical protein
MLERPGTTSYVDRYEWEQKQAHYEREALYLERGAERAKTAAANSRRAANYCSDVLIGDLTPTEADELIRTERGT